MNADNRQALMAAVLAATEGQGVVESATPIGFFESEVELFWPLILTELGLPPYFPLRLRPETEQWLARQQWGDQRLDRCGQIERSSRDRWVRNCLDLLQLAAYAGLPLAQIPTRLAEGFADRGIEPALWTLLGEMIQDWSDWCLGHGLLTYGVLTDLYQRVLLPHPQYQQRLAGRFAAIYADDLDNYPAIARQFLSLCQEREIPVVWTYNPKGGVRLGLGADPDYLGALGGYTQPVLLKESVNSFANEAWKAFEGILLGQGGTPPAGVVALQTRTRGQLLRATAEAIADAIERQEVEPHEVAIIGPGVDDLARYVLIDILQGRGAGGIPVEPLREQRPLNSLALVRSLLTLLALIFPGLGDRVDQSQVAEMLVTLTAAPVGVGQMARRASEQVADGAMLESFAREGIDPVRAGLLADYCFRPDVNQPTLLAAQVYRRWDRLGDGVVRAYTQLCDWIQAQRQALQAENAPTPVMIFEAAIQRFCEPERLRFDQLALLREFQETAVHFWQVCDRLTPYPTPEQASTAVGEFIELLRHGTISGNPNPVSQWAKSRSGMARSGVIIATAYQYRIARMSHRWHFWLDVGSPLWQTGSTIDLWGAPLFLQGAMVSDRRLAITGDASKGVTPNNEEQLQRQVYDLVHRVEERLYLCHSDLSVSGQEQMGALLPLVDAAALLE
jgi:hypothetical protein